MEGTHAETVTDAAPIIASRHWLVHPKWNAEIVFSLFRRFYCKNSTNSHDIYFCMISVKLLLRYKWVLIIGERGARTGGWIGRGVSYTGVTYHRQHVYVAWLAERSGDELIAPSACMWHRRRCLRF